MNVCTKFHAILRFHTFRTQMVLLEKSGEHQSQPDLSSRNNEFLLHILCQYVRQMWRYFTGKLKHWKSASGTNVRGSPKCLGFFPRGLECPDLYFMAIHPIVVEIIRTKPKMPTSQWRWRKSQWITKVIRIHPLGSMNVCTKFHSNPFNSC